eukprot:4358790-Prymnesium_polylepis.2
MPAECGAPAVRSRHHRPDGQMPHESWAATRPARPHGCCRSSRQMRRRRLHPAAALSARGCCCCCSTGLGPASPRAGS